MKRNGDVVLFSTTQIKVERRILPSNHENRIIVQFLKLSDYSVICERVNIKMERHKSQLLAP